MTDRDQDTTQAPTATPPEPTATATRNDDLPEQAQNAVKDPSEWTTGDEPMTGPQASYLTTLLQQAGRPESDLDPQLTKALASTMIDELQKETGRGQGS